ncbi:MAG: right-handed parallel beta-helix repeat-containing protein [Sandaracinaceae bacterium]|nr:right-handed parallel beta-helix repeat-containing protein [Sandaracinaceae bacterium]
MSRTRHGPLSFLWIACLAAGCGTTPSTAMDGGTSPRDGGPRRDAGTYMGGNPATSCEGHLDPVAHAGRIEVVGDGTAASCTEDALHAAVAAVNGEEGGGSITFDCGGEHTITLTRSVFVETAMILDGGGNVTLSGGNAVRVIELDHYVDFVVQRLTIRDGFVPAGAENESGAGLLHPWFGTLKVIDCTFDNNHSASQDHDVGGGAIYAGGLTEALVSGSRFQNNTGSTGGAILSRSTNLRVVDTVFFNNSATTYAESGQYGNGGGLYIDRMWLDAPIDFVICGAVFDSNHAKVHGSAFFSYNLEGTRAVFDRCTFRNNDMEGSPGGTGSVYHEGVPLVLVNSTFSGNSTNSHAGGLFLGGGSDAQISNCTFVDNSTPGNAGGLWAGNGDVTVEHCTFAGNSADYAPAIFKGSSGTVTLTDTVFSNNTTQNAFSAVACHETFNDGGGNVQWPEVKNNGNPDTPCSAGVLFADPQVMSLADNGGPTETMALPATSPAIDHAVQCTGYDQRGTERMSPCDSGAFEHTP